MAVEIVTKEDLNSFKLELLADIRLIIEARPSTTTSQLKGYKTKDVRAILGCSRNTLIKLVAQKKIRRKKIEGVFYFNEQDLNRLLNEGY